MKCPECGTKITAKHYDPEYEWYECPKCEGAFTVDEIEEARRESSKPKAGRKQGDRKRPKAAKADRGGRAQRKNAGRANGKVSSGDVEIRTALTKSGLKAKGKKRRTEIAEDEKAVADWEKDILVPTKKQEGPKHHRDEIETRQVVAIWGDEFEDIYHELGMDIDTMNAQDKALILWREIHWQEGATAREQSVPHAACVDHE